MMILQPRFRFLLLCPLLSSCSQLQSEPDAPQLKKPVKQPAVTKTERERRRIFAALVALEDKANADAERIYSPYTESTKYLEESERLTKDYKATFRQQERLSEKEAQNIGDEGVEKAWPPLKPRP